MSGGPRLNAFTVDVEDYFQVENFAHRIDRREWDRFESRLVRNTERVLGLLDQYQVQGTFFILGWNAERFPELVRRIAGDGHEVASHGYHHRLVYEQRPEEFADDIATARELLAAQCGQPVIGYRAPSYSITAGNLWAFDCLKRAGYRYDSSIYPIQRRRYGIPGAPRHPHRLTSGLVEFPMTTWRLLRWNLPAASGGYLRLLPLQLSTLAVAQLNKDGHPAVVNVHPWELDPDQPRVAGGHLGGFTHYANLHRTRGRLEVLLSRFRFGTMRETLAAAGFQLNDA